jgi:uncharacterized protein YgiM (DUF1202 family)
MKTYRVQMIVAVLLVLLALAAPTSAQTAVQVVNPSANITWPPPVYVVAGDFTIRGTANLPNMTNYFIEYALMPEFDPTADPNAPQTWFPATLPSSRPVQDGILGLWDTTLTDDGVYSLRLTVRVRGGQPVTAVVAPVRVQNTVPPFGQPIISPSTPQPPPVVPTAAPTFDPTPRATANGRINVRSGDSTIYPVIMTLNAGQTVPILGLSNLGTGWYYVQLPDGRRGWVAPSVVDVAGDFSNVPRLAPPPLPVTPTLPPTFTPASAVNLVAGIVVFDTTTPTCATTFTVGFDVANQGVVPSPSGTVSLVDTRAVDGSVQGTATGAFPVINPGTTFRVNIPLTISTWYNETHIISLTIDPGNLIVETNEGDNRQTVSYVLVRGTCP